MNTTVNPTTVARKLRRFFGHFPQVGAVHQRLQLMLQYTCTVEEPEHILLLGDTGTGKSTLLKRFIRDYPPIEHLEFTEVPVLYVGVPSSCTSRNLAGILLKSLGSPFWNKGDEEERTSQLMILLKQCKVRMVILDEVNHLIDRGGEKSRYAVGDWIKVQSTEAKLPFVLAGIVRSRALLETNEQLADRFRETLELHPLSVEDDARTAEFAAVMGAFASLLEDLECIDLRSPEVLSILAFATAGRLRNIRRLLVRAVELAAQRPQPAIDLHVLEQAFLEVIFKKARPDQNPFNSKFRGTPLVMAKEPFAPAGR